MEHSCPAMQHAVMSKAPRIENRIEEVRKAKGLTLEEVAQEAGLSVPYVWQMANGVRNISLKNLAKLAAALGVQPEDLLATKTGSNADILNVWAAIPAERRELAMQVLQSFTTHTPEAVDGTERKAQGKTAKRR